MYELRNLSDGALSRRLTTGRTNVNTETTNRFDGLTRAEARTESTNNICEGYGGLCPTCQRNDGKYNDHGWHFCYCLAHRVRWYGDDYYWGGDTPDDTVLEQRRIDTFGVFELVEAYNPYAVRGEAS